jgi:hypothetical protein
MTEATKRESKPPKPRKNPLLWQAWQHWDELMKMRMRHNQRIAFINSGKCNLDPVFEKGIATWADGLLTLAVKEMANYGAIVGHVWEWLISFKGIGESLAAQLLAQIDNIMLFATVSKLRRFAGFAVFDGKREIPEKGDLRHYNTELKSTVYKIVDQFIRQQTPVWVDLYYAEKERLRARYPETADKPNVEHGKGHLDRMARRKVAKEFLKQLWIVWRRQETHVP